MGVNPLEVARERRDERDRLRDERDRLLVQLALRPAEPERLEAQVRELTDRLAELASVDVEVADAERALEVERIRSSGHPHAARLADIQARLDVLEKRAGELDGLQQAAVEANELLVSADVKLDSAASYSTADLFLNGALGMQADMLEHSRANEASFLVFKANAALQKLAGHLAGLGRTASQAIDSGPLARNLDLYWDNLTTDIYTRIRLADAQEKVAGLQGAVSAVLTGIDNDRAQNAKETEELLEEQARLRDA